ncbi:MAG: hypothetical protein J3K34DRAFT_414944 [Monoraphidium minutum]|nr:MAG: hypothetical protein J3K34DRAFT_414944 [Monoraphidium minutum]
MTPRPPACTPRLTLVAGSRPPRQIPRPRPALLRRARHRARCTHRCCPYHIASMRPPCGPLPVGACRQQRAPGLGLPRFLGLLGPRLLKPRLPFPRQGHCPRTASRAAPPAAAAAPPLHLFPVGSPNPGPKLSQLTPAASPQPTHRRPPHCIPSHTCCHLLARVPAPPPRTRAPPIGSAAARRPLQPTSFRSPALLCVIP